MAQTKELPHNTEAEKAVLGAMLHKEKFVADGCAALDPEDFYEGNQNHRAIFSAMLRLYQAGHKVDSETVVNELINTKELEIAGGVEYLVELADGVVTYDNFNQHCDLVREQSVLRNFLVTIDKVSKDYYSKEITNVNDFLAESEKKISAITEKRKIGDFKAANVIAGKLAEELKTLKSATSDDTVTGTPTGFPRLNSLTHGFQKGELIILAARPGVGKTALALNLAYNAAAKADVPVAYFSLEMPANMLFKRLVAADASVKFDSLITGFGLGKEERLKVQQSCERLATKQIFVDDTSGIRLLDLVAKCRKLKAQKPDLGLIVVDYIGLVTTSAKTKAESRQLEVQQISQTLKKLAMDLDVPVIGVAQLNRNVEQRQGGEPQLSDLRESGSIEQDADIVMMLHEAKLSQEKDGEKEDMFKKQDREIAEAKLKVAGANNKDVKLVTVLIRKNRSGRLGDAPLLFMKDFCRFDSPSRSAEEQIDAIESERVQYMNANE